MSWPGYKESGKTLDRQPGYQASGETRDVGNEFLFEKRKLINTVTLTDDAGLFLTP